MKRKILKCVTIMIVIALLSSCFVYGETDETDSEDPEPEPITEDVTEAIEEAVPIETPEPQEEGSEEVPLPEETPLEPEELPIEEEPEEEEAPLVEESEKTAEKERTEETKPVKPAASFVFTYRVFTPVNNSILEYPLSRTAILTSGFGPRTPFMTNSGQMSSSNHRGIDLAIAQGTPVVAAESGTVTRAEYNDGYGMCVFISHGDGLETRYAHMSQINVDLGQKVVRGQQIGLVGSTGNSTGPHLHFEVLVNGVFVDPIPYLEGKSEKLTREPKERVVEDIPLDLVIIVDTEEKTNEIHEFIYGDDSYIKQFVNQNVNNRVSVIFTSEKYRLPRTFRPLHEPWVTIRNITNAKSQILYMPKEEALSKYNERSPKIILELKDDECSVTCSSDAPSPAEQALLWQLARDFSWIA